MSNPLLDLISRGESGAAGYNAYNRGMHKGKDGLQHFRGPDKDIDLSQLTVGEVLDFQHADPAAPDRLFAVGKYQIIPSTLSAAVNKLSLNRDELFTPEIQDRIFSDYLIVHKQPAVYDFITGKPGASIEDAQRGLAREWASFGDPDKDGRTHYSPPNHASITLKQSADALNHMRAEYQASISRGLTPDAAWQVATDSEPTQARTELKQPVGTLRQGAHNEAVKSLQSDLAALGYTDNRGRVLQIDGHYGPSTEAAVRAFQGEYGLSVDGVAGRHTLQAIHKQSSLLGIAPAFAPELDGRHPAQMDALNTVRHIQVPAHNPFADPSHPDHGLYTELKERIPDASENRLTQLTAACHLAGIKSGHLQDIHISKQGILMTSDNLSVPPTVVDITTQAPLVEQSVQQVQAYDHQCAINAQMRTQELAQTQTQHGATMGGPLR